MANIDIDANRVIEILQNRIGELVSKYETEIAVRDAIINQQQEDIAGAADEVVQ